MKEESNIRVIWDRLSNGDETAFEAFYDIYYNSVFAYCLGKIKDIEHAENAAADVFVRIIRYKDLKKIENPENWIFTIARNICLNHLNKKNRRSKILDDISWTFEKVEHLNADQALDVQYVNEQIEKKLKEEDYRIWQFHEQGYDNKEIAKKLDKNEKTVANRKVEVIKKVKEIVQVHLGIVGN